MPTGFPVIISAPSGTGKSTVCREILRRNRSLRYSVSCTTRPPRPGEKDGRDYHFLASEDFKRKIHRDHFLEWAVVHDHYYGTPKDFLDRQLEAGRVVLLAIDVRGAQAVRRKRPNAVTVFLAPPSWNSLQERLSRRRQDPAESVVRRLSNAPAELSQAKHYDYLVVNDSLDEAVRHIECVLTAERLRTCRQDTSLPGIGQFPYGKRPRATAAEDK